jgi:hypothetical protein
MVSQWRWGSVSEPFVEESGACASSSSADGEVAGLQSTCGASPSALPSGGCGGARCQGYCDGCRCCNKLVCGSSSNFRRQVSMTSFAPRSELLGVHPRPMFLPWWFNPDFRVGWLLRLSSKPMCEGVPPDLGRPWFLLRRQRLATARRRQEKDASSDFGMHWV